MWAASEEQLLRQARAGDREAFDSLRRRLEEPARRFVRRLLGRSDAEEDILQDAFVALYVHRGRIEPAENLRPYLYRILRNLCYGELRRRGRFRPAPLQEAGEGEEIPLPSLVDPRPGPEERAHWTLIYAQVQQALQRLPELQRQTLILFCGENLSHAQVAVAMNTDPATVKSRLHLARGSLRRLLGPETLDALGLTDRRR